MKSKHGVYYDLKLSTYKTTLSGYEYYFSSQVHLDKFIEQYRDNRRNISESLTNRFDLTLIISVLADMVLYKKIESRGFRILNRGGEELCKDSLKLGCEKVILTESNERLKDSTAK